MSRSSDSVTLLFTSDLHGRLSHRDPFTGEPFPGGLTRVATVLAECRRRHPHATYLDLGDAVQGTPVSVHAVREAVGEAASEPHPLARLFGELGCVGLVVGNHEFNYGLPWLDAFRRAAPFPLLAANVLGPGGAPFFDPVLWLECGGRRVAVLALTTPQVPRWEEPANIAGLTFRDALETVREWVPRLRREADAVVLAAHMGWDGVTDGGLELPSPPENDVGRILTETDGFDVVLMAHAHRREERRGELGTLAVQAGAVGGAVGEVTLRWEPGSRERGGRERPRVETRLIETGLGTSPDPGLTALVALWEKRAARWAETVVGTATAAFDPAGARYRDNPVLTLLHRAQREAADTELSSATLFHPDRGLAAGPVRVLDLFRIYPFENSLTVLELTVDDVRAYLEEIALAYVGPAVGGEPPPLDERVKSYNHDSVAGAEYVIDPGLPAGRRVTRLTFGGEEWPGERTVGLALSSYRAAGGGGYRALRRGRVVLRTKRSLRDELVAYVRRRGTIAPEADDHWSVVGA